MSIEPITGIKLDSHSSSPARADLEVILHHIDFTNEAAGDIKAYQELTHKLREEKEAIFQKLVELYKTGDLEACYAIGCAYGSMDSGCKRSPELAQAFYLQAAKAGHPQAMSSYAFSCKRLNGLKDSPEVIKWLKAGAEACDTTAMHSLACRYREGASLEQDYVKAEYWFITAFDKGYKGCAYSLGKLYEFHIKDYDKAYEWYSIHTKQRPKYFRELAWFLNREDTKYYNPTESLRLKIENWHLCIEISRPVVCGEIAEHYLNGRCVDVSREEALKWLRKKLELLKPDTKLHGETKTEIESLEGSLL